MSFKDRLLSARTTREVRLLVTSEIEKYETATPATRRAWIRAASRRLNTLASRGK